LCWAISDDDEDEDDQAVALIGTRRATEAAARSVDRFKMAHVTHTGLEYCANNYHHKSMPTFV